MALVLPTSSPETGTEVAEIKNAPAPPGLGTETLVDPLDGTNRKELDQTEFKSDLATGAHALSLTKSSDVGVCSGGMYMCALTSLSKFSSSMLLVPTVLEDELGTSTSDLL